jgi:cytochrome c-type biogenesis protein
MSIDSLVTSGPLLLAMPVAAAAGAVTFLSPCCLPLVPGYLAYITGMSGAATEEADAQSPAGVAVVAAAADAAPVDGGGVTTQTRTAAAGPAAPSKGRAVAGTALFVIGFSLVFAIYGLAAGGIGQLHVLRAHSTGLTQVLGGLTILLGLLFAGAFDRFTFAGRIFRPSARPKAGLAGAPLLGIMFGIGWSPCVGPTLTAVLALDLSSGTAARGAFLAFIYGLGLGIPFLIVAAAFQRMVNVLGFFRRNARMVSRIGGAMLIVVGLLEVTGAWTSAIIWLRAHWFSGFSTPL